MLERRVLELEHIAHEERKCFLAAIDNLTTAVNNLTPVVTAAVAALGRTGASDAAIQTAADSITSVTVALAAATPPAPTP